MGDDQRMGKGAIDIFKELEPQWRNRKRKNSGTILDIIMSSVGYLWEMLLFRNVKMILAIYNKIICHKKIAGWPLGGILFQLPKL